MAKTIKFNLICNEKPIRTIEDLQNNFVIEDVLELYYSKLLERWLNVRGYIDEFKLVSQIVTDKPIEIIEELIKIFDIEEDSEKIREYVYIYEYKQQKIKNFSKFNENVLKDMDNVNNQLNEYNALVSRIFNNPDNAPIIKACIKDIINYYYPIFKLNHRELFNSLLKVSKLAILCLLMYEPTRKFYIYDESEDNKDKKCMYNAMCQEFRKLLDPYNPNTLNGNIVYKKDMHKGYWSEIESVPCLILKIKDKEIIREKGIPQKEFKISDINPQADFSFPIFHKGLEHTNTTDCLSSNLVYMII